MPPGDEQPRNLRVWYDVAEMFDRLRRDMSEQHGRVIELLGTKADKADLMAMATRFDGSLDGLRAEVRAVTTRVDDIEAQRKSEAAAHDEQEQAANRTVARRERLVPAIIAAVAVISLAWTILWTVLHG